MSADHVTLWTFAAPREAEADPFFDEELAEEAIRLLAGGDVGFKLATRVAASSLPTPRRRVFTVLRRLPERWFVPPALAKQEGFYDYWQEAVDACESPDDQLLAMPKNRRYGGGWSMAVECRPLDETDKRRFLTLQSVFGARPAAVVCTPERRDRLVALLESLPAIDSRLRAVEDEVRALKGEAADASKLT